MNSPTADSPGVPSSSHPSAVRGRPHPPHAHRLRRHDRAPLRGRPVAGCARSERPCDRARRYSAYAAVFVDDATRAQRLTARARDYSHRALCQEESSLCEPALSYEEFQRALDRLDQRALPILYADATAWATWLRARSTDPLALADLPRITAMLERVVALDPAYERGEAQLYLGVLFSQLPPALGGRPELGKE